MSLAVARIAGQAVPGVKVARAWSAALARNGGERARSCFPSPQPRRGEREGAVRAEACGGAGAGRAVGPARSSGDVPAWRGGGGAKGPACSQFVRLVNQSAWEERHGWAEIVRQAVRH
jgi:hypothetical protein